jgi:hypothetical protein
MSASAENIVPHAICWPRQWNAWSQLGRLEAVQADKLTGHDDRIAVDDLGRGR